MRPNLRGSRVVESPWVGSAFCALMLVAGAWAFLPSQVIWLDEATQLAGLTLDPVHVVRWLARAETHDFGQFPDRMPPVSYWLGSAWGRAFGADEASLRWLGVACVATATALVFLTARRAFGGPAGWAAGLLFATSPGIAMIAVEIRAYPLFLLASAASYHALIRVVEGSPSRRPIRAPRADGPGSRSCP
jgi:4-amino-4-deoxy-L-arabinose transferase-like glycosyltransferase